VSSGHSLPLPVKFYISFEEKKTIIPQILCKKASFARQSKKFGY